MVEGKKKYINKQAKPKLFLFNCKPRDDNLVSFSRERFCDKNARALFPFVFKFEDITKKIDH